jgi:hypothetical protein
MISKIETDSKIETNTKIETSEPRGDVGEVQHPGRHCWY